MRIEPFLAPASLGSTRAEPRIAFADLMSAPAPGTWESTDSAVGFEDRGMFGRFAAVALTSGFAVPDPRGGDMEATASPADDTRGAPSCGAGSGAPGRMTGRPAAPSGLQGRPTNGPDAGTPVMAQDAACLAQVDEGMILSDADLPEGGRLPAHLPRRAPSRTPGASPLQLRLGSAEAGRAAVAVMGGQLTTAEIDRFRERAEAVMREFGLTLDKVAVNGEGRSTVVRGEG